MPRASRPFHITHCALRGSSPAARRQEFRLRLWNQSTESFRNMTGEPCNITLIGFMGSGKSTVGRALAGRRDWRFVDTDEVISRTAGRDIPTLFAEEGEAKFRDRETQIVLGVCAGQRQVIATGGGAILRPENVAALRGAGVVIWLTARPDVVVARTRHRAQERPLLAAGMADPLAHVLQMLGERGPLYQAAAHLIVDTSDRSLQAIVREIERKTTPGKDARCSSGTTT